MRVAKVVLPVGGVRLKVPAKVWKNLPAVKAIEGKAHCLPYIRVRRLETARGYLNVTADLSQNYR